MIVKAQQLKLDLIEHDEGDDHDLGHHVQEQLSNVCVLIHAKFE